MNELQKLMEKKKKEGKKMDPMYKDSKMSMLKALRSEMSGMMKDDLDSSKLKKVEVASDDKEGLKFGLDKAKQLVEGSEGEEDSESPEMEALEGEDEVKMGMDKYKADPSPENLELLMACLQKKKSSF